MLVNKLNELLKYMNEINASDLHLSAKRVPQFRINGEMIKTDLFTDVLTTEEINAFVKPIMSDELNEQFQKHHEADFSYSIEGLARFRVNCFQQERGMGVVFRIIPNDVKSLEELNLDPAILKTFKDLCKRPRGLVLVTGPTGSGKSTTLAAMIDFINTNRSEHILTIEDPIEFIHQEKKCLINQREVHKHTDSFSNALRASLREDPDIILVGEMRDLETIRLALTAAETGHLVFGTLHTSSAAKTIDRIIDAFPAEEKEMVRVMLSESLQAVISQALIKKQDGSGRVAAHEIMVCTAAIRNLIRENKGSQMYSAIQTGSKDGMRTLDQSLKALLSKKLISIDVARELAKAPSELV